MKKILKDSESYKQIDHEFEKWWRKDMKVNSFITVPSSKYFARKAWFASRGFEI